jgi:protein-tyrosine phosphatase
MNEIFPGLYIGNAQASSMFGSQFDTVVNCTSQIPFAPRIDATGTCLRVSIDDHPSRNPDMLHVAKHGGVLEAMHDALMTEKKVLVHCAAGMQRSCAIVAFYLIKYFHFSLNDAMTFIRQQRPVAFYGGATFLPALSVFEREHHEENKMSP